MAMRSSSLRLPALAVEHVLLQQRKERLHGGVVATGAHSAHRAGESVVLERAHKGLGSELGSSVRVNMTVPVGRRSAMALRRAETAKEAVIRSVEAVADDAVGVDVLDGTAVELALGRSGAR